MHSIKDYSPNFVKSIIQHNNYQTLLLVDENKKVCDLIDGLEFFPNYEEGMQLKDLFENFGGNSKPLNQVIEAVECLEKDTQEMDILLNQEGHHSTFLHCTIRCINTAENEADQCFISIEDYTEEKEAEEYRLASNRIAKIGTWEVDLINNTTTWSEVTTEIHETEPGYNPTIETGINFYRPGYSQERIKTVFFNAIETGEPFKEELQIVTQKGNIKWIETYGVPQIVNGKCLRVYGTFQDINERKLKELKLIENEAELRVTFEYSPIGKGLIDKNGNWMNVNQSLCNTLGYSKEELLKTSIQELAHPDDVGKDMDAIGELINKNKDTYKIEKRYIHKNGKVIHTIHAVSKVMKGDDYFLIVQISDISERKNIENQLKEKNTRLEVQNKELEQFAYITSHDLQEPLRTITSFTDLLSSQYKEVLDDKAKTYLRFLNEAAMRMSRLVKSLLDYNRLGKHTQNKKTTSTQEIVENVLQDLALVIQENKANIEFNGLPEVPVYEQEFRILMQNLINNGIKFTPEETIPEIKIKAEKENNNWEFAVIDNGIGIDAEYRERVFLIFQRLHARDEYPGSGIGLAHCKKIVNMHGGNIWIEENPTGGTIFKFSIPEK